MWGRWTEGKQPGREAEAEVQAGLGKDKTRGKEKKKKRKAHVTDNEIPQDNEKPEFILQHHIISASVASVAEINHLSGNKRARYRIFHSVALFPLLHTPLPYAKEISPH